MQSCNHLAILLAVIYALHAQVNNAAAIPKSRENLEPDSINTTLSSQMEKSPSPTAGSTNNSSALATSQVTASSDEVDMTLTLALQKENSSLIQKTSQNALPIANNLTPITSTPNLVLQDESHSNGSDLLKEDVTSSCSSTPQEIQVCNSVQEGVNIAASVLGSLPRLQGPQGEPGPIGPRGKIGK